MPVVKRCTIVLFAQEEAVACNRIQRETSGLYMECSCLLRLTPSRIIPFIPTQPQSDFTWLLTKTAKDF